MLAVILKILSILGIILLVLLCIAIFLLLLILFLPVVYSFDGEKSADKLDVRFRMRWLFGLFRAGYAYPDPGRMTVRFLWFTVFDSGEAPSAGKRDASGKNGKKSPEEKTSQEKEKVSGEGAEPSQIEENVSREGPEPYQKEAEASEGSGDSSTEETKEDEKSGAQNTPKTFVERIFAKYEKIKYTIRKIYDRIRHILENLDFYKTLLEDEETKGLFLHAFGRLGKVLHHIRPKKLTADIVFGTGSPDTTGYVYGIYGMFSPRLGKDICITPDFTETVFEGRVHAKGHLTAAFLLLQIISLLLDKRLRTLIRRLKTKQTEKQSE